MGEITLIYSNKDVCNHLTDWMLFVNYFKTSITKRLPFENIFLYSSVLVQINFVNEKEVETGIASIRYKNVTCIKIDPIIIILI